MKVILLKSVQKIGKKDQIIEVSEGYARNALCPKGLAVEATEKNLAKLSIHLGAQEDKKALEKHLLEQAYTELSGKTIVLAVAHTKEGVLFKKVTVKDIVVAIAENTRLSIDPLNLIVENEPIKQIGAYTIGLRDYPQYTFVFSIV